MTTPLPLTLEGSNLGARHHHFNSAVTAAFNAGDSIEKILEFPETSSLDRLFKIDLASKHNHLKFILTNLQDEDMLYVSRALKSKWLLQTHYSHIINPNYLEIHLYPHMITTAVNKMKHWIYLNLRNSERCLEFYQYYCTRELDYAFKFLCKCPEEIVLREFPKPVIIEKMTPQKLKLLCEKTPDAAKLFYDTLNKDKTLLKLYRRKEQEYFHNIKSILKTNSNIFLDITEQNFLSHFKRLSTVSTKYIMSHQKDRFLQKSELYVARILNLNTVAQCLTPDECEDLVIKLARARYLADERWFSYKNVEPFIKRIDHTKRQSFKNKVFVEKDIGESVLQWPYPTPKNLYDTTYNEDDVEGTFLESKEFNSYNDFDEDSKMGMAMYCEKLLSCLGSCNFLKKETYLDNLYKIYRFKNFNKTFYELRKKIKSESSSQNRMHMFLVLVSKSGGKSENLHTLFSFLLEFQNEPSQVRSAVVRSLVKRASVWRVSEENWNNLLRFGQGLGLDGGAPETECVEGLHAVVIRTLLSNNFCENSVKQAFLKNFSTLNEYSLVNSEKSLIKDMLLKMLIESAKTVSAKVGVEILGYATDTLEAYNIKFDTVPDFTTTIKNHLENDKEEVKYLLERLYRSKLGRKELFVENFDIVQTDASYLNALKHDITILSTDAFLKALVVNKMTADQFLRKIRIYFHGKNDLTGQFLFAMKETKLHKSLIRPITYLIGNDLEKFMLNIKSRQLSAQVKVNAHIARPALNIDALGLEKLGAKFVENKIIKCKGIDIDYTIKRLLTWKRTARLAIILAQRTTYEAEIFAAVAKLRPIVAFKTAIAYFRRQGDKADISIWKTIKQLFPQIKLYSYIVDNIRNVDSIPITILPEYLEETFKVVSNFEFNKSLGILFCIKLNLTKINDNFTEIILTNFVQDKFTLEAFPNNDFDYEYDKIAELYLSLFSKYLLICKDEQTQKIKFGNIGQMYLDRLKTFWDSGKSKKKIFRFIDIISTSLQCTEVFLSNDYVSCLPVMENIVRWMRGFIAVDEHFDVYVPFHLNMLFYKTIRHTVQNFPGLLDDKQKRNEAYKVFGEAYGRYVGEEARVLSKDYFDSIILLYGVSLVKFLNRFNRERFRMAPYFIKGIIDVSEGIESSIAITLYKNIYHVLDNNERRYVDTCLSQKKTIETQFYYENWLKSDQYFRIRN